MNRCYFPLLVLSLLIGGCRSSLLDDPTTVIRYNVEQPSNVKLTVENSYNTVIATLVDSYQASGAYAVAFDMTGLPEGIYFVTIEARGTASNYYYQNTSPLLLVK